VATATVTLVSLASTQELEPAGVETLATVRLTADDRGAALFDQTVLAPGRAVSRCIELTYEGDRAGEPVHVGASGVGGPLAGQLRLRIEEGTGGRFGDCTDFRSAGAVFEGTLAELGASAGGGVAGVWAPVPGEQRSYRIRAEIGRSNALQGASADADLVWAVHAPGPEPEPEPEPKPEPKPEPEPEPEPGPEPKPEPKPEPEPEPEPKPEPRDEGGTEPAPQPAPNPAPQPGPTPQPGPGPSEPAPETDPTPTDPDPSEDAGDADEGSDDGAPGEGDGPGEPEADGAETGDAEGGADESDADSEPDTEEPRLASPAEDGDGEAAAGGRRSPWQVWRESVAPKVMSLVMGTVENAELPLALLVAMILFLIGQNRLDSKDPKLALAPMHPDPDLPFDHLLVLIPGDNDTELPR
jgi:hypothetical protein